LTQYRIAEEIAAKLALSDPTVEHHLGHPHLARRNFAEALKHYSRSIELEPRHVHGHIWKAATYEEMEHFEKAVEELREVFRLKTDKSGTEQMYDELREAAQGGKKAYWEKRLEFALKAPEPALYHIATIYARLKDKRAYEYLRKACEQRSFTQNLMFDLCWDHSDPEFSAIARKIGIIP
jgi:tetratricopeptide (TPR) repeat protein